MYKEYLEGNTVCLVFPFFMSNVNLAVVIVRIATIIQCDVQDNC